MLQDFIATHRDAIILRTKDRVKERHWPLVSSEELENGVPLFLTQLVETLQQEDSGNPFSDGAIGLSATQHGRDLLGIGFNVSQVVHDYGDICQAVTEIAVEKKIPITVEEFHTLNRCLDTAIAEAVTEHARITADTRSADEIERLGRTAHELRDVLTSALLAFHMLRRGTVAINGSTGAVLGRSLMSLRDVIDQSLSEVRLASGTQQREPLPVVALLHDIAETGMLHSEYRKIEFTLETVDPGLTIDADRQLLTSAVMNLLQNAFKYTPAGGIVVLRARVEGPRLIIEIEDRCGGIPESKIDIFKAFGDRRGADRSGLGLGLSIARKAVRAHGGDIHVRNLPGTGCIFSVDMPLAQASTPEVLPQGV